MGALLSAFISTPQAWRSLKVGTAGVSATTFQLVTTLAVSWAAYGVAMELWLLAAGNIVLAASSLAVLYALKRDGHRTRDLLSTLVPALVLVAVVGWIEPTYLGWLAGLISFTSRIPQTRLVMFANEISGVSLQTWIISGCGSICWLSYGLIENDPRLAVMSVILGSMSLHLIVTILRKRSTTTAQTQLLIPEDV